MCFAHANVTRCTRRSDTICQLQSISPSFPFRIYAALLDSLSRQLRNVGRCMKRDPPDSWGPPDVLHYRLAGWCHPVTICYASKKSDEQLLEYRKVSRSLCEESPWFLAWKVCYKNKLKSFCPPPKIPAGWSRCPELVTDIAFYVPNVSEFRRGVKTFIDTWCDLLTSAAWFFEKVLPKISVFHRIYSFIKLQPTKHVRRKGGRQKEPCSPWIFKFGIFAINDRSVASYAALTWCCLPCQCFDSSSHQNPCICLRFAERVAQSLRGWVHTTSFSPKQCDRPLLAPIGQRGPDQHSRGAARPDDCRRQGNVVLGFPRWPARSDPFDTS